MGKFERFRNIRQRRKRELQMRPGRVQRFFTAVLSVITAGCIPKQRRYNVPFSFENPVYGSQTIEDIVGLTKSNTNDSAQDNQRSDFCTRVTNLQREQKEPGTQRTERITRADKRDLGTNVEKIASQPETQTQSLFVNGSCKESSGECNGNRNTRKFFIGNDSASEDEETVLQMMPGHAASPETSGNNCSGRDLAETESAKEVDEASSVKQERKLGRLGRFLSSMSSALTCCVPSAKRLDVPFSFENPVHESKTIENLLNLAEWTTLNDHNCELDEVSQSDSYAELNRGDLDNTDPGSVRSSKDCDQQRGNSNGNDTDKSTDRENEDAAECGQTSSSGSEPRPQASSGRNASKLKRSFSWTQDIDSFWDGCTRFKREGLFSCGLLRTTNPELREQRLAERKKEKDEKKRKEMEDKFGPAKYGYAEDTPLDVYIFNECLWPECDDVTEEEYVKTWGFDDTGSGNYEYTRKSYDTESDQEDESDEEYWGVYGPDSDDEEEDSYQDDNPKRPKLPPKKVPPTIKRSLSWPLQLNKADANVDDAMKSCGILISTEREKRERKQPGLKIRNDTLHYIVWRFYYEGQS